MGDELCCSKQNELDDPNAIKPETIIAPNNNNNYGMRINPPKFQYFNNNQYNGYNNDFIGNSKYNYKIQKNQLMYVKRNINQRYDIGKKRNHKKNKNINKNRITNNISLQLKPIRKKHVKMNELQNKNMNDYHQENNAILEMENNFNNNQINGSNDFNNYSNNNLLNNKNIIENEKNNIFYNTESMLNTNNQINNNNIIQNSNINNNISSNFNFNQNPTFAPNIDSTSNNLLSYSKIFKEDLINQNNVTHQFDNIFENISTKIANDPAEIQKMFQMIDKYKYKQAELKDPVLSDEEVDDLLKKAEKDHYQNKTIDYSLYSLNNNQNIMKQNPYNAQKSRNLVLTPERKKVVYPLTPDYQIRRKKINNNDINNYKYQYNNYKPITTNTPQNTINYKSPQNVMKVSGKNYYPKTPDHSHAKHIYIQSPTKINPPIIQNSETYYQAKPVPISKIKPQNYNIIPQKQPKKVYYKTPVNYKIYQKPNIPVNNINLVPIKNNSSKGSILNKSYLNQIQKMNQDNQLNANKNKYNILSNITSNNPASNNNNLSFITSQSGLSKTPRKLDKSGNPIYFPSLNNTAEKLKNYENYKKNKIFSTGSISSLSDNGLSAPQGIRRKRIEDYYIKSPSSYESPLSTPRRYNRRINNNLSQLNKSNLYSNSLINNNDNSFSNITNNKNNNNNLNMSTTKVSFYEEEKDSSNMGIIETTQSPTGLKLDEHTQSLINNYLSKDLKDPSTFNKTNYNLFYFQSTDFFRIPKGEITAKRKLIYNSSNDPSQQAFYEGEVNNKNERHGFGTLKEANSTRVGLWKRNKFSGWGRDIRKNGQIFEGKFDNDILSGKGIYNYSDVLYIGDFDKGIRQGKGVLLTKNFKYKGTFNAGKIDGYGKIVFLDEKALESEYEGSFKDNKIEGYGVMIWKNGNMYQGEMKDCKMNGRGRFIPKDGIPTDGVFKDNVKVNI